MRQLVMVSRGATLHWMLRSMRSEQRRPAMGDEKREPRREAERLEDAARKAETDLRDDLKKAVEFEKADLSETHRE